jgi:hypothetical protein
VANPSRIVFVPRSPESSQASASQGVADKLIFHGEQISGAKVRWPVKPSDTAAMEPQDKTVVALLKLYGCESFRVHDGWAVTKDHKSTVVSFSAPLNAWEKILQELVSA